MSKTSIIYRTFAATLLFVVVSSGDTHAAASVNFASAVSGTNLQSDGSPMDSDFAFQIGAFSGGFKPSADNTGEWQTYWVPLSDAAGDPISGATTTFATSQLPSPPFPAGTFTTGFSGTAEFDHSQPPFDPLSAVYIWGYDQRSSAGPAEWLLVTSSTWSWPAGTGNPPTSTFSIGEADSVILGNVNGDGDGDGYHMQSAAVTVSPEITVPGYDQWLAANFSIAALADPTLVDSVWGALADPDGDGIANVIEYFTASDPNGQGTDRHTRAEISGEDLVFIFYQAKDTGGVVGVVEWSADLVHWSEEGVVTENVEDLGEVLRVEARIPGAGAESFARLNVRRSFE
jgi:hypothetical protein